MCYSRNWSAFFVVGAMLFSGPTQAWGPEGHAMIAEIAEMRLASSPALDQVKQILAADDSKAKHLDQIASWADAVRPAPGNAELALRRYPA
jgi:hypothetical protein